MQLDVLVLLTFVILSSTVLTKPMPKSYKAHKRFKREEDLSSESIQFTFDCKGKAMGFYADQEHNCQYFHMCDGEGRRIPYVCANETSFNQEFRICDWEYNFDCSEAHKWYYLNELTYATETQDDEENDDDADGDNNGKEYDEVTSDEKS